MMLMPQIKMTLDAAKQIASMKYDTETLVIKRVYKMLIADKQARRKRQALIKI